ncbi:MAG TPA: 16S rRNA (cytosine(967)-C(5))-methyltransferase RsmB [Candidatus Eisenbacteria bacterium]|nr:16S rRNA (cytosine(967)-C(5))-methyltransferase RsmB [Candidatus Eisenbacteria bacterium]
MSASEPNVRALAADILLKIETRKAYADVVLDRALESISLSSRDRALLTELIYGTLRWQKRLDHEIRAFVRRPSQDPWITSLLRVSLYQLLFLTKIPAYAAVNDAVALAKRRGRGRADFVNAVLRSYLRENPQLPKPDPQTASTAALAVYWSHPEWLVRQWQEYFGSDQIEALLKADNEPSRLVLRVNSLRAGREELLQALGRQGIEAGPTRWSPQGIVLRGGASVPGLPGFREGLFSVQGEASQLIGYLVSPNPGMRILDACAAPGGKSTHLAELMQDEGEVLAVDVSARSLDRMAANVQRLGLKSVRLLRGDITEVGFEAVDRVYDRVLLDAPCSGLGTLRAHPEIKWQRTERDLSRLARLQLKLLFTVADRVKAGGVLVYSTCTLSPQENESVVESFLTDRRDFQLDVAADHLPAQAKSMICGRYFLALPHVHGTDGFFAARMTRLS